MKTILKAASGHATLEVKYHALYTVRYLGYSARDAAILYSKSENTIKNWIKRFDRTGSLEKKRRIRVVRKICERKEEWILHCFKQHPVSFLDEAKEAYAEQWKESVSESTIWRVLTKAGLTWKVLDTGCLSASQKTPVDTTPVLLTRNSNDVPSTSA